MSKEQPLFNIIKHITSHIFAQNGFHLVKIIEDWHHIVPTSWHNNTYPLKIIWNKENQANLNVAVTNKLLVNLLQYDEQEIINKLNQYFGYACIIKITFKSLHN